MNENMSGSIDSIGSELLLPDLTILMVETILRCSCNHFNSKSSPQQIHRNHRNMLVPFNLLKDCNKDFGDLFSVL